MNNYNAATLNLGGQSGKRMMEEKLLHCIIMPRRKLLFFASLHHYTLQAFKHVERTRMGPRSRHANLPNDVPLPLSNVLAQ